LGALFTIAARADAAIDPDLGGAQTIQMQFVNIANCSAMFGVTANRNCKPVILAMAGSDWAIHRSGKDQILAGVRHLYQL
jgi:hypothetical protein